MQQSWIRISTLYGDTVVIFIKLHELLSMILSDMLKKKSLVWISQINTLCLITYSKSATND